MCMGVLPGPRKYNIYNSKWTDKFDVLNCGLGIVVIVHPSEQSQEFRVGGQRGSEDRR